MEIKNSYILLLKNQEKKSKVSNESDSQNKSIVLSTKRDEPFRDYLSSCFSDISELKNESDFSMQYECRLKRCKLPNVKIIAHCVRGDYYADISIYGKNELKLIRQMEIVHNTLTSSSVNQKFTLITSYDSVSEYYCNKMFPLLNEVERKFRKLLYIIYTLRYRSEYTNFTFVENSLSPESKNNIDNYLKKQLSSNKETWKQRYFDEFEYKHYKHLLFFPKWSIVDETNKATFLTEHSDLSTLSDEELRKYFSDFTPKSDWERFFASKVDKDIAAEELISKVQMPRNKVAHYKSMTKAEYGDFVKNVYKLIGVIDKAIYISTTEDFLSESMKYFAENITTALNNLIHAIESYQNSAMPSITKMAQMVADAFSTLYNEPFVLPEE